MIYRTEVDGPFPISRTSISLAKPLRRHFSDRLFNVADST
jgi:hypothetical protein